MDKDTPRTRPISYGMKLVHVIPISRGIAKDHLSYFTSSYIREGCVISVPLRKRIVPALVLSVEDVADAKAQIRASGFAVKKISSASSKTLFREDFIRAAKRTAAYYASTVGALLHTITPKVILEEAERILTPSLKEREPRTMVNEKLILQADGKERLLEYKNITREEFAKQKSIFICVPTIEDGEKIEAALKRGIERYTTLLHGSLTKKELKTRWNKLIKETHPALIIATGMFFSLPRDDIGTIIVEREQSHAFRHRTRPFTDMRVFAEFLSEEMGARLILADLPLRVDTAYRFQKRELDEFSPVKSRYLSVVETRIIDMRGRNSEKRGFKKTFSAVSNELKEMITRTAAKGGGIFIYTARRGLSPMTVCLDCGNTVTCEIRNTPLILYKGQRENVFVCHEHGTVRSAKERCRTCGSWKLQSLGIGIELVYDEVKDAFPDNQVFIIDRDSTPSDRQAKRIVEKFYETKGGILIGTEMALPYLHHTVEASAVASIDSLLSIPEWNAYERAFSILIRIKSITKRFMLIQTRKPNIPLLDLAAKGNLADFYRGEIEERKQYGYPPFATFIKLSIEGTQTRILRDMERIETALSPYEITRHPNPTRKAANTFTSRGFIRMPRETWPNDALIEKLKTLPPSVVVVVDPESIL